jgi:hypothetical protein
LNTPNSGKGFFGALYGFMNNTYGQVSDMLDKSVSGGHFRNHPAVAARLFATLIIPAVWTQWIKEGTPDGEDEGWGKWFTKAIAYETAGAMVPLVRDAASLVEYDRPTVTAPMRLMQDTYLTVRDVGKELGGESSRIIQDLSNMVGEWAHIAGLGRARPCPPVHARRGGGKEEPRHPGASRQGSRRRWEVGRCLTSAGRPDNSINHWGCHEHHVYRNPQGGSVSRQRLDHGLPVLRSRFSRPRTSW